LKNKFVAFVRTAIDSLLYGCIALIEKLQSCGYIGDRDSKSDTKFGAPAESCTPSPTEVPPPTHCDTQDDINFHDPVILDCNSVSLPEVEVCEKYLCLSDGYITLSKDTDRVHWDSWVRIPKRLFSIAENGTFVNPYDHRTPMGKWYGEQRKKKGIVVR
jgi:hypothetical protein